MSTIRALRQLYSLDTASPDFPRYLFRFIQFDDKEQYSITLQGSKLVRLVDFLDKVSPFSSTSPQLTEWTPQALDAVPTTDDVSRQCLHKLQAVCAHHTILPTSYKVSGDLFKIGSHAVASGGFSDVWEGTRSGNKVCIKHLRINQQNRKVVEEVRGRNCPIS
jgi:hypothetical protein